MNLTKIYQNANLPILELFLVTVQKCNIIHISSLNQLKITIVSETLSQGHK